VQVLQVLLPLLSGGQEMVGRLVMPGLVVTLGMPAENAGGQPVNLVSPRAEGQAELFISAGSHNHRSYDGKARSRKPIPRPQQCHAP
jgi:hypothetical protein